VHNDQTLVSKFVARFTDGRDSEVAFSYCCSKLGPQNNDRCREVVVNSGLTVDTEPETEILITFQILFTCF
jgi:hypothetical protein